MYVLYKASEKKVRRKRFLVPIGKAIVRTKSLSYLAKRMEQLTFNTILRYE